MTIRKEILDELLKEYTSPQDILGEGGLICLMVAAFYSGCQKIEPY